jgi:BirA family biotin operon repressor/biotin-[acetyl-CoA-carboxylase] ligase
MSMAVPLKPFEGHWGLLPLVMGSAVAGALFDWGVKAKLKWPNDVYIGDKKVCGILGEFVGGTAVIGCGINVAQTQETIGYETATSLAMTGVHVTHDEVVSRVLDHFGRALDVMTTEDGPALLRDFYRASSMTLGQQVRIYHDEDSYVEGLAIDISDDGQLLIDIDGEVQSFASGDVYHLRSQDRGD